MNKKFKFDWTNIIPVIILAAGVIISFLIFIRDNRARINQQNEYYLEDLTNQRTIMIDNLFEENLNYIRTTAYLYGQSLTSTEPDISGLKGFEESTGFERLRFVDSSGNDYTSEGSFVNVADREYFKSAMSGETGITYVMNSRVTSERQIGFYSPVYFEDEIIGFMLGFYGEEFIKGLIDFHLFGYEGEGWLCLSDGTIIDSSTEYNSGNFFDVLSSEMSVSAEELSDIRSAFTENGHTLYSYDNGGKPTTGYISNLTTTDWILIRNFPYEASSSMIQNANNEGRNLIISLIILFTLYILFIIIKYMLQRRRLLAEGRNASDISSGVSNLFEKFLVVNLDEDTYEYIYGEPDDAHLDGSGTFDSYVESLLHRMPNESERNAARKVINLDALKKALATSNTVSVRLHAPVQEDEWFTYNFITIERKADGNPHRVLIARQEVTELRRHEEEEQQVLRDAIAAADRANHAKSDFLSNMSHDIRTPMNAIIGYTNIASHHIDDKAIVGDSLSKISSSSNHLLSLINDILDMSKIESGKLQLSITDSNIDQLLGSLKDMIYSKIDEKRIEFILDTDRVRHKSFLTDPLRLNQVLLNIVGNAVKYTPEGGSIRVSVEEASWDISGDSFAKSSENLAGKGNVSLYRISVADTGIGMSEDYLPHVFESFTRERTSTVDKIQGTGLGMSITKNIVEMLGGQISVESTPGEGTTFFIELPAEYVENTGNNHSDGGKNTDLDSSSGKNNNSDWNNSSDKNSTPEKDNNSDKNSSSDRAVNKSADEASARTRFAGLHLLLAEDNDINAEIASFILGENGFLIDRVENGLLAVNALQEKGPDYYSVVLMDIQMPVMNGLEATAAIRQLENADYSKLPIIAMTANTFDDDKKASHEAGMSAHVAKPFDVDELLDTLSDFINY